MTRRVGSEDRGGQTIVVAVGGGSTNEHALAALCRTLNPASVHLRLVHVLLVPEHAPMDLAMPDAEADAVHALARVQAIASPFGLHVETAVVRGRAIGDCLVEEAGREDVGAVCVVSGSIRCRGATTSSARR